MRSEACKSCRFWRLDPSAHMGDGPISDGDTAFGWCRRKAPVVSGELAALGVPRAVWGRDTDVENEELWTSQVYRASVQPVTESADWCGEFASAEVSATW